LLSVYTTTQEQDPKKKNYAILLVDCVIVEETAAQVLTATIRTAYQDISYFIEDEDESKVSCTQALVLEANFCSIATKGEDRVRCRKSVAKQIQKK